MAVVAKTFTVASRGIGLPDYSQAKPVGQVAVGPTYTLSDLAEAVARLGSINTYDRRGTIVDLDAFEGPTLNWISAVSPAPACYARLDSTYPKAGAQGVRLHVSNVAGAYSRISKAIASLPDQRLGIEISFCGLSNTCYFFMVLQFADGTTMHNIGLRIEPAASTLAIWTGMDTYTDITDLQPIVDLNFYWHTCKLVADFTTDRYVRLLFDDVEYDISKNDVYTTDAVYKGVVWSVVRISPQVATGGDVYLDNYLLTQNEPRP